MKKRNLLNKPSRKKGKGYKKSKNSSLSLKKVITLAAILGISISGMAHCAAEFSSDKVSVLMAADKEGDAYDNAIPIYDENGEVITIAEDGSFMFFDGDYQEKDGESIPVYALSEEGETVKGFVAPEYFSEISVFDSDYLKKYNTVYKISNYGEKVNMRSTPEIGKDNIQMTVEDGMYFLGDSKLVSNRDASIWIPGIIITEEGTIEGYFRSDCVEREDSIGIVSDKNNVKQRTRKVMEVHSNGVPLKMRTEDRDASNSDNKLNEIPDNSIVYVIGPENVEQNGIKWTEVEYNDPELGTVSGWVASDYLKESLAVKKQVKKDINLRVRSKPGTDSMELAKIQEGTVLEIPEILLKNAIKEGDYTWVEIILKDGTRGYVATEYLEDVKEKSREEAQETEIKEQTDRKELVKEIKEWTVINERGNVAGIDVAYASGEELERILINDSVIGDTVDSVYGVYSSSDLGGKINYVYIGIGASSMNSNAIFDRKYFLECADVCEKLGIPYGFYFYSTAVEDQEGDMSQADHEIEYIRECISAIEPDSRKYDLLPFAYDREIGKNGVEDRKLYPGRDTSKITAYTINELRKKLPYPIVLYGGGRDLATSEKILDIDTVNSLLEGDSIDIWAALSRTHDGSSIEAVSAARNIDATQSNVVMTQTILEATVDGVGLDLNIAEEDEYFAILEGKSGSQIASGDDEKGDSDSQKDSPSILDIFR